MRVLATLGGERALAYVLRQLRRGSDIGRQRAARALAHTTDTAAIAPLMSALADRDADVRMAAGWSLVRRWHRDLMSPLTRLLNDPSETVRCEAVAMVASYGDKTVAAPLLPLLGDPKLSVRQQATQVLGAWREQGAVAPMLALLARSQQDEVAAGALLKALGQIASPEALEAVCQLLRDAQTSSTLRLQAALTLAALIPEVQAQRQCDDAPKPTSAEPDLIAFLTTLTQDADPHVCRVALLSLGTFGKDNASAVLLKALRGELLESPQAVSTTSPEPDELGIADFPTSTLAALQAAQTAHAAPAFGERQRVMQRHAASVLRDIDIAGAQEALLSAAESDDVVLRAEALVSLGHRGDPESLAVVRQGCMASNRDVRLAAIEALRRFATADICDVLVDLLRVERDPLVTGAILAVLSSHGDSRAVATVVPKLHDEDRAVQRAALAALAHSGDRTAMEAIRPLLFASGGELCHDAVRALQRLQDTEMGELLLATLSRQEEEDKHGMAIEALAILYGHA